jgi:hypothetical protein
VRCQACSVVNHRSLSLLEERKVELKETAQKKHANHKNGRDDHALHPEGQFETMQKVIEP